MQRLSIFIQAAFHTVSNIQIIMEIRQRKIAEKQKTETFNVSAYADTVGPQALRFIIDRQSITIRKVIWSVTIVFGFLYSAHNIKLCTLRYLSYPSTIKPTQDLATPVRFPKITVCNNVSPTHLGENFCQHYL